MRYQMDGSALARPKERISPKRRRTLARARPCVTRGSEPTTDELVQVEKGETDEVLVAQRYRVEALLGRGGMASVYQAHDTRLGRDVALKVMSSECRSPTREVEDFLREARLTARLQHPHIVRVLNFGLTRAGVIYIAMERLLGSDLRAILADERRMDWPRARACLLQLCKGLARAHRAGIAHLDLKPSNCFRVRRRGREHFVLVDFGIARAFESSRANLKTLRIDARPRAIVGTPEYMSPEQACAKPIDHRADIYALGVMLAELVTGRLPFTGDSPLALLNAHTFERPPSLEHLAASAGVPLPTGLSAVYERALQKRPEDRYPSVEAFMSALQRLPASTEQVFAPPASPVDDALARAATETLARVG